MEWYNTSCLVSGITVVSLKEDINNSIRTVQCELEDYLSTVNINAPAPYLTQPGIPLALTQIEFIEKGMSLNEVRYQLGLPHELAGSGILMDAYLLENGNRLIINYGMPQDVIIKAAIETPARERTFIIE